jgi:hypothetical protein
MSGGGNGNGSSNSFSSLTNASSAEASRSDSFLTGRGYVELRIAAKVATPRPSASMHRRTQLTLVGGLAVTGVVAVAVLAASRPGVVAIRLSLAAGTPNRAWQATAVSFRGADGSLVHGAISGSGTRWAILVPDRGEGAGAWRKLTSALLSDGYGVLTLDSSGGRGRHRAKDEGARIGEVVAALRFARARGARSRYLIGAGSAASAALIAAGRNKVNALVLLSPAAALAGAPRDAIRAATSPKLVFVGSLGKPAADQAEQLYRRSIGWTLLTYIPVHEQATDLLASSWNEQILERILAFLRYCP